MGDKKLFHATQRSAERENRSCEIQINQNTAGEMK